MSKGEVTDAGVTVAGVTARVNLLFKAGKPKEALGKPRSHLRYRKVLEDRDRLITTFVTFVTFVRFCQNTLVRAALFRCLLQDYLTRESRITREGEESWVIPGCKDQVKRLGSLLSRAKVIKVAKRQN